MTAALEQNAGNALSARLLLTRHKVLSINLNTLNMQSIPFRASTNKRFLYFAIGSALFISHFDNTIFESFTQPALGKPQFFAKKDESQKYLDAGRQFFQAGAFNPAAEQFRTAVEKSPESGIAHFEYARALCRAGNEDVGVAEFLQSLTLDGTLLDARKEMAAILMKRGSYDEAGGHLRTVVQAQPEDLDARGNLGICMQHIGMIDQAIEQFRYVEAKRGDTVESLFNLGVTLRMKGEIDEAKEKLAKILLLTPKPNDGQLSLAYSELGKCMLSKKDTRSAIGLEKLAIKYLPANYWAYLTLAEALEKEGKETEALDALRQAVQINPKAPESRAAIARLLESKAATKRQKLTVR
ncbi:MAG: tetratricopeptide repeat protein [Leptolyngbya sp.]|nr:tetratricopeptide repeat protein [Candidatus Melainabacteria bacterium]